MYLVIRCFLDKKIKKNQFLKKEGKNFSQKKAQKKAQKKKKHEILRFFRKNHDLRLLYPDIIENIMIFIKSG